jgi:hypothetical protein
VRLLVYDRTCLFGRGHLSPVWMAGAGLYRMLRRVDASRGVESWDEAFAWLASQDQPITEIQYWGHGKWGRAFVREDSFDAESLAGRHADAVGAVRERLAPDALLWFRTCETFGAHAGHDFAQRLSDTLGARVAGHTYVIAYHQSGLHGLAPGMRPDWSPDEGLVEGTADAPKRASWSKRSAPNTITALTGRVPAAWFVE